MIPPKQPPYSICPYRYDAYVDHSYLRLKRIPRTSKPKRRFHNLSECIGCNKFLLNRGGQIIQGPLVIFCGAVAFQHKLHEVMVINVGVVPLFVGGLFLAWLIGRLDDKFGFLGAEQRKIYGHMTDEKQ
jgi:hypothetical protein